MVSLPSVGVVSAITNPLNTSYFAYLAFIDSWSKVADEVILVDGCSTDRSLAFLGEWVGGLGNVRVIRNDQTYWGEGPCWHAHQLGLNFNVGLSCLDTDWGFFIGADHVVDVQTAKDLRQELADANDVAKAAYYRGKPGAVGLDHRIDTRGTVVNLRLLRSRGLEPKYGMDLQTGKLSDFVLDATEKSCFLDPVTGVEKPIYAGQVVSMDTMRELSVELISYGHFFFTLDVCIKKMRRWDLAMSRFLGMAPQRDLELCLREKLHSVAGFRSKDEIMEWDHPPEILRVIDEFYEPGMVGGWIRSTAPVTDGVTRLLRKLLGAERHLRTRWMRTRGYRGLKELHKWRPLDVPDPELLDVRAVYMDQDRYLSPRYHVDWFQPATLPKGSDDKRRSPGQDADRSCEVGSFPS
jgi:hypothetical protein